VPTLHFHFDRTTERAADMNALIAQAVASRSQKGIATRMTRATHEGRSGAPCMGCCCSTSRWACRATRPCKNANGCCAPKRPGHTGTLDPLATGVLPLCFGAATKFSQLQLDADKTYEATLPCWACARPPPATPRASDRTRPVPDITPDRLAPLRALHRPIRQVPPMHSALKRDGKALYEYAREGIERSSVKPVTSRFMLN
jgi:hypothetical protein